MADNPRAGAAGSQRDGRLRVWRLVLDVVAVAAIAMACILRLDGLRRQGYWSDELFSINESSATLGHLARKAITEIHPPLFAVVLWIWLHVGGGSTNPDWVRLLPAISGILAIAACWLGLRRAALSRDARIVLTVATACNGMSVVYGQEVRSYSLLFLASVGLTAATACLVAPCDPGADHSLRRFVCWGLLASGTHLFGALLVVAYGGALIVAPPIETRRRDEEPRQGRAVWARHVAGATAVACAPQILWLGFGAFVPGFAAGTDWVTAPRPAAVWGWLTSAFGAGQLHRQTDGYRLGSPWLIVGLVVVAVLAGAARTIRRPHEEVRASAFVRGNEKRVAIFLGVVTLVSVVAVFLTAQVVHIWLLRNMIALVPSLTWSVLLGVLLVAGGEARRVVCVVLVAALAGSTIGTWRTIQQPYKDQYAQAIDRIADIRTHESDLHVVGNVQNWWFIGSHHDSKDSSAVLGQVTQLSTFGAWQPPSSWRDVVWVFSTTSPGGLSQRIIEQEGSTCEQIPLVRVALVTCHR